MHGSGLEARGSGLGSACGPSEREGASAEKRCGGLRCNPGWFLVVTLLLTQIPLGAHDMWLDPVTFFPSSGQVVGVRLRVGQDLVGDPLPRDGSLINQFVVFDANGRKPVVGRDGVDPAGLLRASAPGLLVI